VYSYKYYTITQHYCQIIKNGINNLIAGQHKQGIIMTRKTQVIWDDVALTQELKDIINGEANVLKEQGKTDGVNQRTGDSPVPGQNTNVRTWIDLETAEQWTIFINALGVPPVSTAILPEELETP
jgi:hypothetical protein